MESLMSNEAEGDIKSQGDVGEKLRVLYNDDIDYDDDLVLVEGKALTGILFNMHSNGQIECELNYRDGLPEGIQQIWYANGQLAAQWIAIWGMGSSESHEWYANGSPKSIRRNINLWIVELKEWDEYGKSIVDEIREVPTFS
jgi:antitoxin component YwqK of YwqJK toxin-antitoxin module